MLYNNISKSFKGLSDLINSSNEKLLFDCNQKVMILFPKANIPKLNIVEFNTEKYKQMLIQWSNKIFHNTMKRYGSVVQYYLDNLKDLQDKTKSIYII